MRVPRMPALVRMSVRVIVPVPITMTVFMRMNTPIVGVRVGVFVVVHRFHYTALITQFDNSPPRIN